MFGTFKMEMKRQELWFFCVGLLCLGCVLAFDCPTYMYHKNGQCHPCLLCKKFGGAPKDAHIEDGCYPDLVTADSNDKLHVSGFGPLYCKIGKNPECPLVGEVYPVQNGNWSCSGYRDNWFKTKCTLECLPGFAVPLANVTMGNFTMEMVTVTCGIHLNWSGVSATALQCLPVPETTTPMAAIVPVTSTVKQSTTTDPNVKSSLPVTLSNVTMTTGTGYRTEGGSTGTNDGGHMVPIVGGVVGSLVALIIVAVLIYVVRRKCCNSPNRCFERNYSLANSESSEGSDSKFGLNNNACHVEEGGTPQSVKPTPQIINVYGQNVTITSDKVDQLTVQKVEDSRVPYDSEMNVQTSVEDNCFVDFTSVDLDLSEKGECEDTSTLSTMTSLPSFSFEKGELSHIETPRKSLMYTGDGEADGNFRSDSTDDWSHPTDDRTSTSDRKR